MVDRSSESAIREVFCFPTFTIAKSSWSLFQSVVLFLEFLTKSEHPLHEAYVYGTESQED